MIGGQETIGLEIGLESLVEIIVVIHVRGDENGDQDDNECYISKEADLGEIMKAETW